MSKRQKQVIVIMILIILGMFLFPPLQRSSSYSNQIFSAGYGFVFDIPYRKTINIQLLAIQLVGVALVGGLAILLFKDSLPPASGSNPQVNYVNDNNQVETQQPFNLVSTEVSSSNIKPNLKEITSVESFMRKWVWLVFAYSSGFAVFNAFVGTFMKYGDFAGLLIGSEVLALIFTVISAPILFLFKKAKDSKVN